MDLGDWLLKKGMETNELAKILGVSRQVVWKIKKGKPCNPETAEKVYFITGGVVKPKEQPVGWPKGRKRS